VTVDATSIIEYSHQDMVEGITTVASQIENSGFEPDYIVGIARGGAVPAVYLSHKLRVPVQMVHWSTRDNPDWPNESNNWIPEDINGGAKVVIVDDIVDGGDTIIELLADWQGGIADKLNMANIRIATLWYNTAQQINVDFYHKTIDRKEDQRWIVFPWEA
jgi:hypoxanthine phosphoribosyltransferase